jgi:hypothetical protein
MAFNRKTVGCTAGGLITEIIIISQKLQGTGGSLEKLYHRIITVLV